MRFILSTIGLLLINLLNAQAPALIPYQAIARNAAGEPLASSTLNARFTIHDLTAIGASVWQELQTVSTSALGLFTVQLGSGVPLTAVNWASGEKFMQVEIDLGTGFVDIGTQQMLSVPYALQSQNASGVDFSVSSLGDTLYFGDGRFLVINGLSASNPYNNREGLPHTCGEPNIHNPNLNYGAMTDQEGNVYKTIVIGSQEWMAENLNTSIYRNGDEIMTNLDQETWGATTSGAWAYFGNDMSVVCPYGKSYNWYACVDGRQLCPSGWHMPAESEWTDLINYLGGQGAYGKMVTVGNLGNGTGLWNSNSEATNSSGFSGFPGGIYPFAEISSDRAFWWSSSASEFSLMDASCCAITGSISMEDYYRNWGLNVRCLRD